MVINWVQSQPGMPLATFVEQYGIEVRNCSCTHDFDLKIRKSWRWGSVGHGHTAIPHE